MQNVHKLERVSRIITSLFIMSLAFWGPEKKIFLMGFIPAISGWTGVCPLYKKIGLTTINGRLERARGPFSKRSY